MQDKLQNYVIFSRKLADDYRNGLITRNELDIYFWLRINANPYGKSVTSLSNLSNDLFKGRKTENYINKLLLSLKSKRYIYYKQRSGRRGTFEVHLGDFLTPNKTITSLDKFFEQENVRALTPLIETTKAEPNQNPLTDSQSFRSFDFNVNSLVSAFSVNKKIRGSNNDTDNDTENDKNRRTIVSFKKEKVYTESFRPDSYEKQFCFDIAVELGEKRMDFLLSILDRYGLGAIEKSRKIYDSEVTSTIKNKPAFFNSIVKKVLAESGLITGKNLY